MNSGAIVYLLRSTNSDVVDFIRSLNSLYDYFLINYNYPVLVFIEPDFKEEWKNKINSCIPFVITYQEIIFKSYQELNDDRIPKILITHNGQQKWPLGYRHMCRFWTGDFLDNEMIQKYKYIWRMDTDAYITQKINYDIFHHMIDNNIVYGYSNICQDEEDVCMGLNEWSKQFFEDKQLDYQWDLYKMFTTHVEVMQVDMFKQSLYYDYYRKLDETNHFYIKRWGDAPIRYIAVNNLHFKHEKIDIEYFHGNDGSGRREQLEMNFGRIVESSLDDVQRLAPLTSFGGRAGGFEQFA